MSETRTRRRIRKAVESRGYQLATLEWEPIGGAAEKSGPSGGWYGRLDRNYLPNTWPGDDIMGLSVEEVLAYIDDFVPPPESCECPEPVEPPWRSSSPTWRHVKGCRWRIDYWLHWWRR